MERLDYHGSPSGLPHNVHVQNQAFEVDGAVPLPGERVVRLVVGFRGARQGALGLLNGTFARRRSLIEARSVWRFSRGSARRPMSARPLSRISSLIPWPPRLGGAPAWPYQSPGPPLRPRGRGVLGRQSRPPGRRRVRWVPGSMEQRGSCPSARYLRHLPPPQDGRGRLRFLRGVGQRGTVVKDGKAVTQRSGAGRVSGRRCGQ